MARNRGEERGGEERRELEGKEGSTERQEVRHRAGEGLEAERKREKEAVRGKRSTNE